jgi:ribosomal protein L37AE/L43A
MSKEITMEEWTAAMDKADPMHNRPPCSACGSTYIYSHGSSWECADCGHGYRKHYRGRPLPADIDQRPSCPKCNTTHPRRNGPLRWICYNPKCHHQWRNDEGN